MHNFLMGISLQEEMSNENKTNILPDIDDLSKEKDLNQEDKNIKSASNEDTDTPLNEKGNMGNDGNNLGKYNKRKREGESTENNHLSTVDEVNIPKSSKKKKVSASIKITENEGETNIKSTGKKQDSENPKSKGKSKRVDFSDQVEIFPSSETTEKKKRKRNRPKPKTEEDDGLLRGKRFTKEEDELIKEAVNSYIKTYNLGEEGLKMVLNNGSYPGMENCWKLIAKCIPYRPYSSVYSRAHIILQQSGNHEWTQEEIEFLKESYKKHGNNWKMAAEELGLHRLRVKDKWRHLKPSNLKTGKWSQEEYQSLYDLVNLDLQMKVVTEEKKSKHGMLRDNIRWGAISDKLSTRSDTLCCKKWYRSLTSSLVEEKKWCNSDDYRLISALYDLDASCVEDVDWENVLEHRAGDVCRKRWEQMVLHVGHRGCKPFSELVDVLSKRYRPDLAETMEAWEKIPRVD